MGILSYGLKLSDPIVGFIAGISQFGGCAVYALAYTSFMMYLGEHGFIICNCDCKCIKK
jgi:hypothetical protein